MSEASVAPKPIDFIRAKHARLVSRMVDFNEKLSPQDRSFLRSSCENNATNGTLSRESCKSCPERLLMNQSLQLVNLVGSHRVVRPGVKIEKLTTMMKICDALREGGTLQYRSESYHMLMPGGKTYLVNRARAEILIERGVVKSKLKNSWIMAIPSLP